jgi:hypothetical protein
MNKREAAIVSAYTGFLLGSFSELHKYVEEIMGRPVWTHEMGNKDTFDKIKELAKNDFINIVVED